MVGVESLFEAPVDNGIIEDKGSHEKGRRVVVIVLGAAVDPG